VYLADFIYEIQILIDCYIIYLKDRALGLDCTYLMSHITNKLSQIKMFRLFIIC